MKAYELSVGVYVEYRGKPCKIVEVSLYSVLLSGVPAQRSIEHIFPVPLTAEILEKNGWKREVCKGVDYMTRNELSKERNGENIWLLWGVKDRVIDVQKQSEEILSHGLCVSHVIAPCNFVHELQHALKLCRIEKEIKL